MARIAGGMLHGRTSDLAVAEQLLDQLRTLGTEPPEPIDSSPAALLIEGSPGAGRTRLLKEIAVRAVARGYHLVPATGDPLEQTFPGGVARQLLRAMPATTGIELPVDQPPVSESAGELQETFDRWCAAALTAATDRPLLITIDDLHWCDGMSARWLAYLLRRCGQSRIGVIATMTIGYTMRRQCPADHSMICLLGRMRRLPLHGLDRPATADLITERLGKAPSQAFTDAVHAATGGTPRLLHRLLTEVAARGARPDGKTAAELPSFANPEMAQDLFLDLVAAHPSATALTRALATVDGGAELRVAASLADLRPAEAAAAATSLVHLGVLRSQPRLSFATPLLAAAVRLDVGPTVRADLGLDHPQTSGQPSNPAANACTPDEPCSGRPTVRSSPPAPPQSGSHQAAGRHHPTGNPIPPARSADSRATTPAIAVRCFGGFQLTIDGTPADLATIRPRPRTLLRLLAANAGRPVHRASLVDLLWPDLPEAAGIRNLHVAVSTLRTFLEPEAPRGAARILVRHGESYLLTPPQADQLDVLAFDRAVTDGLRDAAAGRRRTAVEALERALAEYRGELLPEDGPAEWVLEDRERYRALAAEAATALANLRLRAHRPDLAAVAARRAIDIDQFSDDGWRLLILAQQRAGDTAAAAASRRGYARILTELGIPLAPDRAGPRAIATTARASTRTTSSTGPSASRPPCLPTPGPTPRDIIPPCGR